MKKQIAGDERERDLFYRSLINQVRDGILVFAADGSVLHANEAAIESYGYTKDELIGLKIHQLRAPETLGNLSSEWENAWTQGNLFRSYHQKKDGSIFPVEVHSNRIEYGRGTAMVSIVRDITRQRSLEVEANQAAQMYRELVENCHAVIIHLDSAGTILFMNQFGLELLGYEFHEVDGRAFVELLLPEVESNGRKFRELFEEMFLKNKAEQQCLCEVVAKDGRRLWLQWLNRLNEVEGKIVAVGVDVTRQQQKVSRETAQSRRMRWMELLLDAQHGDLSEVAFSQLAKRIKIKCPAMYQVMIICFEKVEEFAEQIDTALDLLELHGVCVAWKIENGIAALLNENAENSIAIVQSIVQDVFRQTDLQISISDRTQSIVEAYQQAVDTVKLAKTFQETRSVVYWCDLGFCKLLLGIKDEKSKESFIGEQLGALLKIKEPKRSELLATLYELTKAESTATSASRLHVHPKTLTLRKSKLERIINKRFSDSQVRMNLAIAIKLMQLKDGNEKK